MTAGQIVLFAACWLAIVAGAVAVVARQSEIASAGYRITAAQAELAQLQHENQLLEADAALLADPERIYRIATEKLGMVPRERFEVTVVAAAEPVVRPNQHGATIASLGADAAELASTEGFWAGLGRSVVGWLTGQPHQAAAKAPDQ
jgi:cell division protein FtsL